MVDAEGELLCGVLPYRPFLVKPNHLELEAVFGRELRSEEERRVCAGELRKRGARNVLVSLAGDGALLLDETGAFHRIAAPRGAVRNSVGAGDSMVAGFLAGLAEYWGLCSGSPIGGRRRQRHRLLRRAGIPGDRGGAAQTRISAGLTGRFGGRQKNAPARMGRGC